MAVKIVVILTTCKSWDDPPSGWVGKVHDPANNWRWYLMKMVNSGIGDPETLETNQLVGGWTTHLKNMLVKLEDRIFLKETLRYNSSLTA